MVDANPDVCRGMAGRYPHATQHTSVAGLQRDRLDCALVLTPVSESVDGHYGPVMALMEFGLPTLCEKPLSSDYGRAEEMVAAAEAAGTLLVMSVNRRFTPVYVRARQFFDGRPVRLCIAEKHGNGPVFREPVTNSIHVLDAMRMMCGDSAQVAGWTAAQGEMTLGAAAVIRFSGGAMGCYAASRGAGAWFERLAIHGEGRTAIVEAPHRVRMVAGGEETVYAPDAHGWLLPAGERWGFRPQLDHFLACVRGEEEPHTTARDALASQKLAEQVRLLPEGGNRHA